MAGRGRTTIVNGVPFDSAEEAARASELILMEKAGVIKGLEFHMLAPLKINGVQVGIYKPDFRYFERVDGNWTPTVEEYKGYLCDRDAFRLKVFQACYPKIRFVKSGPWRRRARKTKAANRLG